MKELSFNIFNQLKNSLLLGYDLEQLIVLFNTNENYMRSMLSELRRDIILEYKNEELYIVDIINHLIGEYEIGSAYSSILNSISLNKSKEEICEKYNINNYNYMYILKGLYTHIFLYGSEEEKKLLDRIRFHILEVDNTMFKTIQGTKKEKKMEVDNSQALFKLDSRRAKKSNAKAKRILDLGNQNYYRFISISDTHFGNVEENMSYLDEVYEYASKHGISTILHGGDLIEGDVCKYDNCKEEYRSAEAQIEHVIDDYLYDKNISNIVLLGNHDASIFISGSTDLFDALKERTDFDVLGYRNGLIKCGKEYIELKHNVPRMLNEVKTYETFLSLSGHSHTYFVAHNDRCSRIKIPTLSDVKPNVKSNKGFLDIQIWFERGKAKEIRIDFIESGKLSKLEPYIKKLELIN